MKKHTRKIIIFIAIIIGCYLMFFNSSNELNNGIYEPPEEKTYIANIISSAVGMINNSHKAAAEANKNNAAVTTNVAYHRDVHAKAHGCVKATFTVPELVDANLRYGIFSEPAEYKAWIRYSSGDTRFQPDSDKDARGMAIKIMSAPGEKLLKDQQDAGTQDFVMINNDVFFIPNVKEYADFMQYQARGSKFGYFFNNFSWNIFTWHLRQFYLGGTTLKNPPDSLLQEQYHSLSAYRLGPTQFMKYSAKSCESNKVIDVDKDNSDFLRNELADNLKANTACFDFMVQVQNPMKNMPVENTTIKWQTDDSPFIKVAKITIDSQLFNTAEQNAFCENLSFTPWHGTKDLEPIGGINRLRKAVYDGISRYRHGKNGIIKQEPQGWCLQLNGQPCPSDTSEQLTTEEHIIEEQIVEAL